jgi:cytochrome c-type biogenesis protein CcmF
MPWLVGTALVHSLAATEKRGVFKSWTVLLAIFAFSLSLLGAFLVRSGVLTSVHAFAVDPERGMYILTYLVLIIGSSLTLYAFKASGVKSDADFEWGSRESMLLVNNLLLVVSAAIVLLGTLYPLVYETIYDGKKISIGPPYFNTLFVPVVMLLFTFMVFSPLSRWKKTPVQEFKKQWVGLVASFFVMLCLVLALAKEFSFVVLLVNTVALWIIVSLGKDLMAKVANKADKVAALFKQTMSYYGMILGHLGIAVSILGVCITVYYSEERDVRMVPGDSVELAGYEFRFNGVSKETGPNYMADRGDVDVIQEGKVLLTLYPEKRFYPASSNVMTEADIEPSLFRDLFVALGEPLGNKAWAVRIHYKPFVRWIWFGGVLIAMGGFITVFDRRYRRVKVAKQEKSNQADGVAGATA